MPSNLLHRLLTAPSLPRARRDVHLRRIRERPDRRRVVCMDRQHGELERSLRVPASMLLPRRNHRSLDRHSLDLTPRIRMVCILLYHGEFPLLLKPQTQHRRSASQPSSSQPQHIPSGPKPAPSTKQRTRNPPPQTRGEQEKR